ncbi:MAG: hypothetical protein LBK95_01295, partial [Bifidobacteriaceae bacterium]|nr:hypothetical protein [Bifidobacteriaceae bacterium]
MFWAVPGVDPPRGATPARTPGSAGVDGYRPVSGPRVEAVLEPLAQVTDPGELIAVMHAAKTMRGAAVLGGPGGPGGLGGLGALAARGEVLDHIVGLMNIKNSVDAAISTLLTAASQAGTVQRVARSTAGAWVSLVGRLTSHQTSNLVLGGRDAAPLRQVTAAAIGGAVNQFQAAAISNVIGDL